MQLKMNQRKHTPLYEKNIKQNQNSPMETTTKIEQPSPNSTLNTDD